MKYYGFIKNRLGQWITYTEGESMAEVKEDIAVLVNSGFPKERTFCPNANCYQMDAHSANIVYYHADGRTTAVAPKTLDIRREFFSRVQLFCHHHFKDVVAMELQDAGHHTLYHIGMGSIYLDLIAHDIERNQKLQAKNKANEKVRNIREQVYQAKDKAIQSFH